VAAILLYHSIDSCVIDPVLQVRPETLEQHLAWTQELGYRLATLDDAVTHSADSLLAVTFDDGFRDFHSAHALLKRHIAPTLFVCAGMLGGPNSWASPGRFRAPLLDLAELKALAAGGVEIGCHGWEHRPFVGRDPEELAEELERCQAWFRRNLGTCARHFAYPFGHCDDAALRAVGAEFSYAYSVGPSFTDPTPRHRIPRIQPWESMTLEDFSEQLDIGAFAL